MLSHREFIERATADIGRCGTPPSRLKLDEPVFYAEWTTGGQEGGNCWGGEATYGVSAEREPELDPLMELLDDLDIRLRHANAILKDVVRGSYRDSGYYGNWTEESYKYVTLASVHDKLVEFGYVEPEPDAAATP